MVAWAHATRPEIANFLKGCHAAPGTTARPGFVQTAFAATRPAMLDCCAGLALPRRRDPVWTGFVEALRVEQIRTTNAPRKTRPPAEQPVSAMDRVHVRSTDRTPNAWPQRAPTRRRSMIPSNA